MPTERWTPPATWDRSLKAIRRRLLHAEAGAPGLWVVNHVREQISFQREAPAPVEYLELHPDDPATYFILAAKQDVATLLGEVERLEGFLRELGMEPRRPTLPFDIQALKQRLATTNTPP